MYIATVPNRTSPPAILIRESFRHQGKVKSRTLANISDWDPARIEALRRALRGDFDHLAAADPTLGRVFGLLYALRKIAEELGITAALGMSRLGKLALFIVLVRLAHQGSRLSAVRWAEDHAVAEVLGLSRFDEDDLYAALDDLCARQEKIERTLYQRYLRRRAAPPALFLYDVTSSYLEGEHNALGEFGYNRDGKRGKLQIVIGLLADSEGEPPSPSFLVTFSRITGAQCWCGFRVVTGVYTNCSGTGSGGAAGRADPGGGSCGTGRARPAGGRPARASAGRG